MKKIYIIHIIVHIPSPPSKLVIIIATITKNATDIFSDKLNQWCVRQHFQSIAADKRAQETLIPTIIRILYMPSPPKNMVTTNEKNIPIAPKMGKNFLKNRR